MGKAHNYVPTTIPSLSQELLALCFDTAVSLHNPSCSIHPSEERSFVDFFLSLSLWLVVSLLSLLNFTEMKQETIYHWQYTVQAGAGGKGWGTEGGKPRTGAYTRMQQTTETQKLRALKLDKRSILKMANKKIFYKQVHLSYPATRPNPKIIQVLVAA